MARPHIEGYRDRATPWRRMTLPGFPRGMAYKVLSLDAATGAVSLKARCERGFRLPGGRSESDVELYVLAGAITVGDAPRGPGSYLFVPAGVVLPPIASRGGAQLLLFYNDGPPSFVVADSDHPRAERDRLLAVDVDADLPWSAAGGYPVAAPGRLVKVLRADPRSRALTCLYALAPNFRDDAVSYHDCSSESYQIAGDFWNLQSGTARAGSYLWRPPFVNHGPCASKRGALLFARSDGELVDHRHFTPTTTPDENRAQAASRLRFARPHLYRWIASGRARAPADFEHPEDRAPRPRRRRARG